MTWFTYVVSGTSYYPVDVYAQRVDSYGAVKWTENGVPVCTAGGQQLLPGIAPDGSGGAIIAWQDKRASDWDIYVQRIGAGGSAQWTVDGAPVCVAGGDQGGVWIISDDAGGAIIAWRDGRGAYANIYAQRVAPNGAMAWTAGGIAVCPAGWDQSGASVVSDGAAGSIVAWVDSRSGAMDVYAQRIGPGGSNLWPAGGVAVCTADSSQAYIRMVSDGAGGAIIAWQDRRSGEWKVYAQRIDANGSTLWTADGIEVCASAGAQVSHALAPDDSGGAIITWCDHRGGSGSGLADIDAQRIDAGGSLIWPAEGVAVCVANGDQTSPVIVSDDSDGAVVTWFDQRDATMSVYAQKLDGEGAPVWASNGVPIASGSAYPALDSDGAGGAIITFMRWGFNYTQIFAQRIERNGYWGYPSPEIVSIEDAPDDDGGMVRVTWEPSRLDAAPDAIVSSYTVWREDVGAGATRDGESSWVQVGSKAADYSLQYMVSARTVADSSSAGPAYTRFRVVAETSAGDVYWTSTVDSGYSVDNFPPMPVEGFAGAQSITPVGLNLSWDEDESPDVAYYSLHKEGEEGFVPDASNLVGTTSATVYFDPGWSPANNTFYYKVLAVDEAGNRSDAALLRPQDIAIGTLLYGYGAVFTDGGIDVTWRLSEAGRDARFAVLRGEGRTGAFAASPGGEIAGEGLSFAFRDDAVEPGKSYRYRVDVSDEHGGRTLFETDVISIPEVPLTLYQNHPNPFNPSTSIAYYLPEDERVVLEIFDVSGRRVALLANELQHRGTHAALWNGLDARGKRVRSGAYFYRLRAGKAALSRTMILLR